MVSMMLSQHTRRKVGGLSLKGCLLLMLAGPVVGVTAAAESSLQQAHPEAYAAGYRAALESIKAAQLRGESVDAVVQAGVPAHQPVAPGQPLTAGAVAEAATPMARADAPAGSAEWWNHSSLSGTAVDGWRHALQAQLSYTSLSGNDEGSAWRGSGKWHSRWQRWTNELSFTLDKRNIRSSGGTANLRDYRLVQESLRYDLTPNWYVSGGLMWERDDMSLVDRRVTALLGVGRYWLDTPRLRLNTYLAYGQLDERYMTYVRDHVGIHERDSPLVYFYQTLSWKFTDQLSLRQGFRWMRDLDESGRYVFDPALSTPPGPGLPGGFERYSANAWVKRYRTITAVDLDYRLNPRTSVSLGWERRHDSNPWPDVMKTDTVRRVMLNLSF